MKMRSLHLMFSDYKNLSSELQQTSQDEGHFLLMGVFISHHH